MAALQAQQEDRSTRVNLPDLVEVGKGVGMPGKLDIMNAIRKGLDDVRFAPDVTWGSWTQAIYAKLCEIGQEEFGCYVCVQPSRAPKAESLAWLYAMTWLEYTHHTVGLRKTEGWLVDAHLLVDHRWARTRDIETVESGFSRLLLGRAGVRLMVCYDWREEWRHEKVKDAESLAGHLAEWVRRFNGSWAEDAYLLAVLGHDKVSDSHRFQYFTLGLSGVTAW